jgi:zinc D-Ala-D-Ala dipeptidase
VRRGLLLLAAVPAALWAAPGPALSAEPLEQVGLERLDGPDVRLAYATPRNFTGRRLPGYRCATEAWLRPGAARAAERADRRLRRDGLALRVLDAYRPARATRAMVRWAKRTGNDHLLNGWIARRSNHNRGAALDATLVDVATGRPLGMGTAYDAFTSRSATRAVRGRALRNRLRLARALTDVGFRPYEREWWHFDWPAGRAAPRLDVPIECSGSSSARATSSTERRPLP